MDAKSMGQSTLKEQDEHFSLTPYESTMIVAAGLYYQRSDQIVLHGETREAQKSMDLCKKIQESLNKVHALPKDLASNLQRGDIGTRNNPKQWVKNVANNTGIPLDKVWLYFNSLKDTREQNGGNATEDEVTPEDSTSWLLNYLHKLP